MYALLSGAIAALSLVIAVSFARAYKRSGDRFFAFFAAAFVVLGVTTLALGIRNLPETDEPLAYLPRLSVYALVLGGIVEKNRRARRRPRVLAGVTHLADQKRRRAAR